MKKVLFKAMLICSVIALVAIACVHEIPVAQNTTGNGNGTGTGTGTGSTACDTNSFKFSTVINPMIQSACISCHGASSAATSGAGIDLSTWAKIKPYADNGRLFGSINHSPGFSPMPKGGAQFSSCQITEIKKWVAGGAVNDTLTGAPPPVAAGCDTLNFLYSTTISPLLQSNCIGCHSAGNPKSGGIDLSTFVNAQAFALNGRLLGSVTHAPGYSPMPKGMAQLSACNITQLKKWIAGGAKNDLATGGGGGTPTPTPLPTSNCSADTVYFQNTIGPLIASSCTTTGCHDAITKASGVDLTTYTNILKYVNAGNANGSKLYSVMARTDGERMPPAPLSPMSANQLTQVKTWINQGAKNNFCSSCDTTTYTYALAVQPLMATNCVGCHSTASAGGGIDLSSYAQVKVYATNGRLFGSINHTPGYSAMPKNQAQMPACQIIQIKKWIDAGALNN